MNNHIEQNLIEDENLFEIVKEHKPTKLEVVKNFGNPDNCNSTIKKVAWALKRSNIEEAQARSWLTQKYGQQYSKSETMRAVKHAMDGVYTGEKRNKVEEGFSFPSVSTLPGGQAQRNAKTLGIKPCDKLPESPDPLPTSDLEWLKAVFAHSPVDDPLLYVGTKFRGNIEPLSYWSTSPAFQSGRIVLRGDLDSWDRGFADQVIANRMEKLHDGTTKSGGRSIAHCIDVPEVLTFEMDGTDRDQQMGVINYLAKTLPLVTVVDSGNESLHATFSVLGLSEELLKSVFLLMFHLGADPSVLRPHQLSRWGCAHRLPKEGDLKTKEDGAFQECLFMDSKARARKPDAEAVTAMVEQLDSIRLNDDEEESHAPPFELYFLQSKTRYILIDRCGIHNLLIERIRAHLKRIGVGAGKKDGGKTAIENVIVTAERTSKISFCGALAGHTTGLHTRNGISYVCDQGPTLIEPVQGDCSTITGWMTKMFAPEKWNTEIGGMQYHTVMSWLKIGAEALRNGTYQVGQLLALAGESGSGKSQFQSLVITPVLGGRSANPFKYLSGQTDFNANLYGAEHLTLDDEALSKKTVGRIAFGQKLKGLLVAGDSGDFLHAKGVDGVNIRVQRRVSMSLNDDEADLAVLPPLSHRSMADKIILLHCAGESVPMPTGTNAQFEAFKTRIKKEIPAFLWHLLNEYAVPESVAADRYGVASYKNPDLMNCIHDDTDEAALESIMNEVIFEGRGNLPWQSTTAELKAELTKGSCPYSIQAREILNAHPRRLDSLLKNLQQLCPQRYTVEKGAGNRRIWSITR